MAAAEDRMTATLGEETAASEPDKRRRGSGGSSSYDMVQPVPGAPYGLSPSEKVRVEIGLDAGGGRATPDAAP